MDERKLSELTYLFSLLFKVLLSEIIYCFKKKPNNLKQVNNSSDFHP